MATTRSQSRQSRNGKAANVGETVKDAGETAASAARKVNGPMLAAGAAAAGVAGGLIAGSRGGRRRRLIGRRRRVLGIPVQPKSGALRAFELMRDGAKHLQSATNQVTGPADDVHQIREQLEESNRRSPIEVVLDGLTHRPSAGRGRHD